MNIKTKLVFYVILFSILSLCLPSCFDQDDYDFDRLSEKVDWTPNMIVPVGYGTYSLWYLLNQHEQNPLDQTITLDKNGFLHIKYTKKDLFNYNIREVLDFPAQSSINLSFMLPDLSIGIPYALLPATVPQQKEIYIDTAPTDIILSELKLNTNLQFEITNPLNTEVEITASLPNGTQAGTPVSQTYLIAANAIHQREVLDLSNLDIQFKTPYTNNNLIAIEFNVDIKNNNSGIIRGNGDIGIDLNFQNIDFILAKGDFGKQNIDIGTGNIDMGVDFWDNVEGDYKFADPRVLLYMANSIGVPFQINANMTGYSNEGNTASLDPLPSQPEYPANLAEVNSGITDVITYDKNNSKIVDLMALPPSRRIKYFGSINLNPDPTPVDLTNSPNLLANTSGIALDIEIDIPLDFSAKKLMLRDTINDIDIEDAEKIMNAAVVITTENGYPLDAQIEKIYFTDAAFNKLDSIIDNKVIDAAGVYPAGNPKEGEVDVSTIKEVSYEVELTQSQIKKLNNTRNMLINASVKTSGTGTESVKLKGDYELKFKIAVQAQIDLKN